jgi:hypothetical protein
VVTAAEEKSNELSNWSRFTSPDKDLHLLEMKKSLADKFFRLNSEQRCSVHFTLSEQALENWYLFTSTQGSIDYVESITGSHQVVDQQLPFDAFIAARQGMKFNDIARRYQEPIAAMQDEDLEFPGNITFTYYAIYNLFQKYALSEIVDDWLIINQALASKNNPESMSIEILLL